MVVPKGSFQGAVLANVGKVAQWEGRGRVFPLYCLIESGECSWRTVCTFKNKMIPYQLCMPPPTLSRSIASPEQHTAPEPYREVKCALFAITFKILRRRLYIYAYVHFLFTRWDLHQVLSVSFICKIPFRDSHSLPIPAPPAGDPGRRYGAPAIHGATKAAPSSALEF